MAYPNGTLPRRTGALHRLRLVGLIVLLGVAGMASSWVAARPHELSGPSIGVLDTWVAELGGIGGAQDLTEHIGQQVELVIDSGQAMNDVAFWTGWPPDDFLVVISRDTRTAVERQTGRSAATRGLGSPPPGVITVAGVIEPVPYPEATYSWGLTRRDVDLLAERGVFIRLTHVVSSAPHVPGENLSAEEVDEHGRETAPPPGDEVETTVPPPLP